MILTCDKQNEYVKPGPPILPINHILFLKKNDLPQFILQSLDFFAILTPKYVLYC